MALKNAFTLLTLCYQAIAQDCDTLVVSDPLLDSYFDDWLYQRVSSDDAASTSWLYVDELTDIESIVYWDNNEPSAWMIKLIDTAVVSYYYCRSDSCRSNTTYPPLDTPEPFGYFISWWEYVYFTLHCIATYQPTTRVPLTESPTQMEPTATTTLTESPTQMEPTATTTLTERPTQAEPTISLTEPPTQMKPTISTLESIESREETNSNAGAQLIIVHDNSTTIVILVVIIVFLITMFVIVGAVVYLKTSMQHHMLHLVQNFGKVNAEGYNYRNNDEMEMNNRAEIKIEETNIAYDVERRNEDIPQDGDIVNAVNETYDNK